MTDPKPTCFIAMPITTHPAQAETYGDPAHWLHVMEHLFVPAIELAGFKPVRPITKGSYMIHDQIVKNLGECDLVLVDLSTKNPNVFFELGVRTSLNKPVCLIADEEVRSLPFDTSGINTERYDSALRPWTMAEQLQKVAEHIGESAASCNGTNPMWRQYGLTITAEQPSATGDPEDARLEMILQRLDRLTEVERVSRRDPERDPTGMVHIGLLQAELDVARAEVLRLKGALRAEQGGNLLSLNEITIEICESLHAEHWDLDGDELSIFTSIKLDDESIYLAKLAAQQHGLKLAVYVQGTKTSELP